MVGLNWQYTVKSGGSVLHIAVLGGGPGGLYFAYLWKKRHPEAQIDLFEQNAADATWGFGVVFSEQALEFLRADDPDTVDAIAPRMESWKNITLNLRGESVAIDGVGFSGNPRLGWGRPAAAAARFRAGPGITALNIVLNYRRGLMSFGPIQAR